MKEVFETFIVPYQVSKTTKTPVSGTPFGPFRIPNRIENMVRVTAKLFPLCSLALLNMR